MTLTGQEYLSEPQDLALLLMQRLRRWNRHALVDGLWGALTTFHAILSVGKRVPPPAAADAFVEHARLMSDDIVRRLDLAIEGPRGPAHFTQMADHQYKLRQNSIRRQIVGFLADEDIEFAAITAMLWPALVIAFVAACKGVEEDEPAVARAAFLEEAQEQAQVVAERMRNLLHDLGDAVVAA